MNFSHLPPSASVGLHAVVEEGAAIGEHVSIGHFCIIARDAVIGDRAQIGHHSVILPGTVVGHDVVVGSHCVLGIKPRRNESMRLTAESGSPLRVGDRTYIGSLVTLYRDVEIGKDVFIGDQASIRERVVIGDSSVVGRSAVIELNVVIGKRCTIQTLAYVTGDTVLEDHVFIGPCVAMSNDKYMGAAAYTLQGPHLHKGAKVGSNSTLLPGVHIGEDTIVGAGAVVTKPIQSAKTVVGVPATPFKVEPIADPSGEGGS